MSKRKKKSSNLCSNSEDGYIMGVRRSEER